VRLADGVSFVHLSLADTPDGSNPLPGMTAFQEVGRDSPASCHAAMPLPTSSARITLRRRSRTGSGRATWSGLLHGITGPLTAAVGVGTLRQGWQAVDQSLASAKGRCHEEARWHRRDVPAGAFSELSQP
jgi:hypothetical protein